jgi:hypothetical protein
MRKAALTGALCFLLGTALFALAQSTGLRPDQFIALVWTWTATQSSTPQTLTISTATFTPVVGNGNNIKFTLTAACPCTYANWSGTPIAGTSGVLEVMQGTGGQTITTWGSQYIYAGGTATIALSAGAGATDTFSYYVRDSTHTLITTAALNATH